MRVRGYLLVRRSDFTVDDYIRQISPQVDRLRKNETGFDLMARFVGKSEDELRKIRDEIRLLDGVQQAELIVIDPWPEV